MEFRHLRYFLMLAEELHFGRAAQRLSISQPPLSLNIQHLEASVGAQLFTRNSRGVQLTAAGQAFVPAARALLDQAGLAAREAREVSQGMLGSLQIGFAGTVLYRGLPQILQGFAVDHPKLRLVLRELSSSDQLIDLMLAREAGPYDRAIDVQVSRLRQRLGEDAKEPAIIKTVRGQGYVFAAHVEAGVQ